MRILACVILLLLISIAGFTAPGPSTGASLARLQVYDLSGKRHTLDEVKTKAVVIVWWAFWCDTWKKALPQVIELASRGNELGYTVWTVSIDGSYTSEIKPLVEKGKINFPVLLDNGGWIKTLRLRRVPTVMVLDRQRNVIWLREAYPGNTAIEQALKSVH